MQHKHTSPVEAKNETQCAAVVTLIHGTFARDATWTEETSPLCKALARASNGKIRVERFGWSGGFWFKDRVDSAEELRLFINRQRLQHKGIPLLIVGHSHGGSVLAYLLKRNPDVTKTIAGAAFLATPFIDARARPDWPLVARATLVAMSMCLLVLVTSLTLFGMTKVGASDYRYLGGLIFWIWFITYIVMLVVVTLLARHLKRVSMARLADSLSCSHLPAGHYLFLRCTGDEAMSALSAAQFFSWLMSLIISSIVRLGSPLRDSRYPNVSVFFLLVTLALVPWGGIIPMLVSNKYLEATDSVGPMWWITEMLAALVSFGWLIGPVATCGAVLFLVALMFSILWVLCSCVCCLGHISFGRFSFGTTMFIDLAVDAVPVGEHELIRLPWSDVPSGSLFHSSPYQSTLAIETLVNWVKSVLPDSVPLWDDSP